MSTFVFDFDSTLIPGESLEEAFRLMDLDEEKITEITAIANEGMAGNLPFKKSLERRLNIARPHRSALERAGALVAKECTKGVPQLVEQLHRDDHEVWIVSGGFKDLIDVAAKEWQVPLDRVHAVGVDWDDEGNFLSLKDDGFAIDKVEGLRRVGVEWGRSSSYMIGDGMTDYQLKEAGLVDTFIAYTEHAQRPAVIANGDHVIPNMLQLKLLLTEIL